MSTEPKPSPSTGRIRAARLIAIAADALQIAVLPAFAGGVLSIVNDVLDVVVAILMVSLVGWHFAFLPSFVAELIPVLDLVPTWTLAVWFATRKGALDRRGLEPPDAPGNREAGK
jgi:hypothetical protein